jgi:hypothetical protein
LQLLLPSKIALSVNVTLSLVGMDWQKSNVNVRKCIPTPVMLFDRVRLESSSTGCTLARVGAKLVCFARQADSVMLGSACVHL